MVLELKDWRFEIDREATQEKTRKNAADHCCCAYCRNYYDTVSQTYPELKKLLECFGVEMNGPCELMPFEPTLFLACYPVQGRILTWGYGEIQADGVRLQPEASDDSRFLLWVGEVQLPWVQPEREQDVVSPANLPEFLERMKETWQFRHGQAQILS